MAEVLHRLSDDTPVFIRPIRSADKLALQRGLIALSDESTRARFLAPKDHFSRAELAYLTEVDGHDHVAFVAFDFSSPSRLVAAGRFVRDPEDPQTAEMAITVADHLQGKGLGRILGNVLADAARAHGVRSFSASLLSENAAALHLFRTISQRLHTAPINGPVREIFADLAA